MYKLGVSSVSEKTHRCVRRERKKIGEERLLKKRLVWLSGNGLAASTGNVVLDHSTPVSRTEHDDEVMDMLSTNSPDD